MLFMTNAQLKYTSFGILTIFIKLIQTTPSDVEAFDLFLPHFTILIITMKCELVLCGAEDQLEINRQPTTALNLLWN